MRKQCYKCGEVKDLVDFHKHSGRPDGRQSSCKSCSKKRNAEYYKSTPEKNAQRSSSRGSMVTKAKQFVFNYLDSNPCVDCGESDPIVLEFDHVRGVKSKDVSRMMLSGYGITTIAAEIEKCDVRCANCHRRVTALRAGWTRNNLVG